MMPAPQRVTLAGRLVTIVPFDPDAHAEPLYRATHGPEKEDLWRYLHDSPFPDLNTFSSDAVRKAASQDPLFFTILDYSNAVAGRAAYLRIDPPNRVLEVGAILYAPKFQRTAGATEAMYLMARHAFDDLGCRRYEWKCNAANARSQRAALRLGFTFEGIFRQHQIVKGLSRDTAWFSLLDTEWPSRRARLERWLDPSNFDASGVQKLSLSDLQNSLPEASMKSQP